MKKNDEAEILSINEFQPGSDMAFSIGYQKLQGISAIEKPHRHDFFIFLLFEKGSGTHSIDFIDHEVNPSEIHMLFPGQMHKWDYGEDTIGHKLVISRRAFENFTGSLPFSFAQYKYHPIVTLDDEMYEQVLSELKFIRKEIAIRPVAWELVHLRSKLIIALTGHAAEKRFKHTLNYRINPVLHRYHYLIERHYKDQKSLVFYARQLNISPNYLGILCKRQFNVSAMHLIQQRTILEAKRMLHASEKMIKEIAYELGFKDMAYFSHFFKSHTGFSPRQFKEMFDSYS